jgi:hypothetical protein
MSDVTTPAATQQSITDQTTAALDRALSVLDRIYDRKILPDELNLAREIAAGQAALKLARAPASAPPEASGLREVEVGDAVSRALDDFASERCANGICRLCPEGRETLHDLTVRAVRAALAATPDARPDPRAEAFEDAASAVDHMELPQGGNRCEERVVVAAVKLLRSLAALPASPQATTPAPSHDAKE